MITESISTIRLPEDQKHLNLLSKKLDQYKDGCQAITDEMSSGHDPLAFKPINHEKYFRKFCGWKILQILLEKQQLNLENEDLLREAFGFFWQNGLIKNDQRFIESWGNISCYVDPKYGITLLNNRLIN